MIRDSKFWLLMFVFQVAFGLAVFAITRDYYMQEQPTTTGHAAPSLQSPQSAPAWQNTVIANEIARMDSSAPNQFSLQDPVEISRQADVYFSNRQYEQAAQLYERLLTFNPGNAEVHNNLGLTLHYLGRSDEALARLKEGVTVDPENQRIWLTTGYVNSELGNIELARSALTNATLIGDDDSIRQSAQSMLDRLP